MNVSINGTSKEVVQFLLSLSGQIATALEKPAPVVTEVSDAERVAARERVNRFARGAHTLADGPLSETTAGIPNAGSASATTRTGAETTGTLAGDPPTGEDAPKVDPYPKGIPNPDDAPKPDAQKANEPKTRKRRTEADEPKLEPVTGDGSQTAGQTQVPPPAQESTPTGVTLPTEWPLMTVTARRHWAQTTEGLTPSERFELLQANPLAADPLPSDVKPETKAETETKPGAAPAADVECVLPPTWGAWSLPKKIMWATMRSPGETNSLLKQLGFAGKIPDATEETLAQVRRKLEIAMRMEAQA